MRTTLKRRIGRAETNGRTAVPPALLTPVTRYQRRRRGPLRVIGTIFLWLFVVLFVAAGALAGGAWLFINQSVSAVQAHSPEVKEAQKALAVPIPGAATTAIVIGYDRRPGEGKAVGSRSDTVMLVRADPKAETISMLSFPRDLIVEIPGCHGYSSFQGRINEAFTYCGPKGTLQTVKQLTGVPVNYMVTVNFSGFREIVDKLGGVYLDIDQRYFNDNSGLGAGQTYAEINLHAGYQHLKGADALSYVRFRHTDSDLYRVVRQQQLVKALKQQVSSAWSITKLPGIVNTITKNVEVGVGGGGTLDVGTLYGYAKLVYGLPSGNFHQVQLENLAGFNTLTTSEDAIQTAVEKFLNPDVDAAEKAARVATGRPLPKTKAPPPSEVTIEVLNGNGVVGSASDAAYLLSRRGYGVVNSGNADAFNYFQTQIVYSTSNPDGEAAARAVADLFGDAKIAPARGADALSTTLRVVVGQTFHGRLAPAPRDETPERQAPVVVTDQEHASVQVRSARRRVDFPVLLPTVREANSVLSTAEPARIYKVGDHAAFRLVYRTGGGEYWGIQQTSWTDAPILDGPSVTQTIKGREYRLFFNGPHLHMVAFEENGGAYWVVNTLLDRLSNETMLAIAKGLQPRGHN
jgi:LCP family protein required for cell wall assembly